MSSGRFIPIAGFIHKPSSQWCLDVGYHGVEIRAGDGAALFKSNEIGAALVEGKDIADPKVDVAIEHLYLTAPYREFILADGSVWEVLTEIMPFTQQVRVSEGKRTLERFDNCKFKKCLELTGPNVRKIYFLTQIPHDKICSNPRYHAFAEC